MRSQVSQGGCGNLKRVRVLSPLATRLSSMLSDLIAPPESSTSHSQRVVQYSDHYRLAFTLLNENAIPHRFVETWDVQDALAGNPPGHRFSRPTLKTLYQN